MLTFYSQLFIFGHMAFRNPSNGAPAPFEPNPTLLRPPLPSQCPTESMEGILPQPVHQMAIYMVCNIFLFFLNSPSELTFWITLVQITTVTFSQHQLHQT